MKLSQRSEDILKPGGQADIINQVLAKLGIRDQSNTIIGGYDTGSSIALRMSA